MSDSVRPPAVLIVDDEPIILEMLKVSLEDAGFEPIIAGDYEEATATLDRLEGSLRGLVTDVNLGAGGTGWQVAAKGRELMPNLAVVYMTGDSAHEWPVHGVPLSVVIGKPFAPAQVVVALAGLANNPDTTPET